MYRCSESDRAVRGSRSKTLPATRAARGWHPSDAGAALVPSRWIAVLCVAAVVFAAFVALPAGGQERTIVSNQIEVSPNEASLRLEFSDGERLSIIFSSGRASINGESLGIYAPDGAADREWRGLLGRVLSLSNGPLAEELRRWQPDPDLRGAERNLLAAVSGYFAGALSGVRTEAQGPDEETEQTLLQAMARSEDKEAFVQALDGIDVESLTVLVGRDHVVRAGTQVDGGVLLVDGELDIRGRVRGDVIVADGTLTLTSGGRIDGDARLADSRLQGSGDGVRGEVVDISEARRREEREAEQRIRAEVQRELGRSAQGSQRGNQFLRKVSRASEFTFDTIVTFVIVGLLAWLTTGLAGSRVGVVVPGHRAPAGAKCRGWTRRRIRSHPGICDRGGRAGGHHARDTPSAHLGAAVSARSGGGGTRRARGGERSCGQVGTPPGFPLAESCGSGPALLHEAGGSGHDVHPVGSRNLVAGPPP